MEKTNKIFHSEELNKVHEEAQEIVKQHLNNLNTISTDIKNIEAALNSCAIPFVFILNINKENIMHYILWDKVRLLYFSQEVDVFDSKDEPTTNYLINNSKPLITTKAFIRLIIKPFLPLFFKKILNKLSEYSDGEKIEESRVTIYINDDLVE